MSSLLRSTKFVRYFTGAARTLILNSAKVTEANLVNSSKSLYAANNILIRDYATSKKPESLEPLLQKIDSEVRKFGRITKKDIDEVFDEIKSKTNITSSQSLLVIRCCGELVPEELPEQRTILVQKIWNVLTERGIPMDISHYNALLRVYLENEHPFSPAKFLEELEKKGLQPNRVTYQRLMWRYCQEGDVEGATRVLEKMRELSMPVSEPVLNALVMGHAFHGDTDGAKAVLETMAAAGLQPTNQTYTLLACGYAKQGDIQGVENVIKTASEKDIYMTDRDILEIIEYLAVGGHGDKVEDIFHHLQKGFGYNQDVCNLILRLLNQGHIDTAKKVMQTMPKSTNIDDTPFKGAFFVKQLLRVNKPVEEVIKTCMELQEEGLVPKAIYIAAETALQQGHVELAQKLFSELKKEGVEIRQHYYWPLLAQKCKENDEEGLLQILRNMTAEGLSPTGEALRDYVIPYLLKNDSPQNVILKLQIANIPVIHSARNLMIDLLDSGEIQQAANIALQYRPRGQFPLIRRPLLNCLNKTKNIDAFLDILHVISTGTIQPAQNEDENANDDTQDDSFKLNAIGRIVKSAVKIISQPDLCEKLLTGAYSRGLRINIASAEAIQQSLGENMTANLSELLAKLTSAELELAPIEGSINTTRGSGIRSSAQLEHLLHQMKQKGSNVNRIQKQLLTAYIQENKIDKLNNCITDLESTDFELTTATLAQLFEFYCEHDNIEQAMKIKEKLSAKDPNFILNKHKIIMMAFALVKNNQYEKASEFLIENKPHNEEPSTFILNSKCWQMLNYLSDLKEDIKVKELTKVLVENNYIEASNILLGPSIKVHLLKDDLNGALNEFERCCKQYRSTPWKGELMKALIMKEDASKLQWLADLSTQVHGEVNILHDLVLAFVECGRLRQARRILETPGLHTRQQRLNTACERYVEEGKSEYLEGLLEATKELSHIDRSNIFYQLLVTYCKADETDKAIGLWTLLQEEGEIPSEKFLVHLGNHLKSKKRDVPFVIPNSEINKRFENNNTIQRVKKSQSSPQVSIKDNISNTIEDLVKKGEAVKAMDCTIKSIEENTMPKANVIKFLLKILAENGNVEQIKRLEMYINENMKRNVTYDDKLTLAIFKQGSGTDHIDSLLKTVKAATTDEDLEQALKKYPRSNALAHAVSNEDLANKCRKVAELAASKGLLMPANLLWMEYILAGKDEEANTLWKKCLSNANTIVFRRLLQESHVRKQPEIIDKLISTLKTNKSITMASIGNAYSRLINLYLTENKYEDAKATYENALKNGVTPENFNKNSLQRLKVALDEAGHTLDHVL